MIEVCGSNKEFQLSESSNNKDSFNNPVVNPPCHFKIELSSLLAISFYFSQTLWITNERRAFAIGSNTKYQILSNLPQEIFQKEREIFFEDKDGQQCQFISVVCGETYTLYRVSNHSDLKHSQLVYQYQDHPKYIFLNINDREPLSLFGGDTISAVVDTEGAILIITKSILNNPNQIIEPTFLPNGEKAVSVACCNTSIIALSNNCHVYETSVESIEKVEPKFQPISELFDKEITQISGTFEHCFAVSKEGCVFCRGSNKFGQLGVGKEIEKLDEFTEITSLKTHFIKYAAAGFSHSLFQTNNGKILACGNNFIGQLPLSKGLKKKNVYTPKETVINEGATFCVAGASETAVFVGLPPPLTTPNLKVSKKLRRQSKAKSRSKPKSKDKERKDDEPRSEDKNKSGNDGKSDGNPKVENEEKVVIEAKSDNNEKSDNEPKNEDDEIIEEEEMVDDYGSDREEKNDRDEKSESESKSGKNEKSDSSSKSDNEEKSESESKSDKEKNSDSSSKSDKDEKSDSESKSGKSDSESKSEKCGSESKSGKSDSESKSDKEEKSISESKSAKEAKISKEENSESSSSSDSEYDKGTESKDDIIRALRRENRELKRRIDSSSHASNNTKNIIEHLDSRHPESPNH